MHIKFTTLHTLPLSLTVYFGSPSGVQKLKFSVSTKNVQFSSCSSVRPLSTGSTSFCNNSIFLSLSRLLLLKLKNMIQ